jgi:hypothetical protein
VTTTFNNNATLTITVFAPGNGNIPFDPANNLPASTDTVWVVCLDGESVPVADSCTATNGNLFALLTRPHCNSYSAHGARAKIPQSRWIRFPLNSYIDIIAPRRWIQWVIRRPKHGLPHSSHP